VQLSKDTLCAVVTSIVVEELARLRKTSPHYLNAGQWTTDTRLGSHSHATTESTTNDSIDLDSLEFMALATRVATFFDLYETGLEDYLLRERTLGGWVDVVEHGRSLHNDRWRFHTSGSTGTPKPCEHRNDTLLGEARFLAGLVNRQGPTVKRVVCLVPTHHIYGFIFGALLPAALDCPVIRGPDVLAGALSKRFEPGDLIIAVPFLWRQILEKPTPFANDIMGVTSTGACEPAVIDGLVEQGLSGMTEIFGSSETAGIAHRDHPRAPFQLMPRWRRGDTDAELIDSDHRHRVTLMDALDWVGVDTFHPRGRLDDAVQVGGINVFPATVARKLKRVSGVADVQVRPDGRHSEQRLKAFLVPKPDVVDRELWLADIRSWARANLSTTERPVSYTLGDRLPTNAMGKSVDWEPHETA